MPQRRLEYWLLVTSLEGGERIVVDGRGYDVRSGDTYLVQPGRLHDIGSAGGNLPVWIHFDLLFDPRRIELRPVTSPYNPVLGERARLLQPDALALWGVDVPVVVPEALAPRFRAEVPALVARFKAGGLPGRLEANARLLLVLSALVEHAWRAGGIAAVPSDEDRIERAETVARHRLDTGFGLEAFAAAAGLGRSRFCQLYRRMRGIAPGEFLRRARHERAQALLADGTLPVAQIARLAGFADATSFVRAFRRRSGVTPGGWGASRRQTSGPGTSPLP